MRSNRATASAPTKPPGVLDLPMQHKVTPWDPGHLAGRKARAAPLQTQARLFSGASSAGLVTTGRFSGARRWLRALARCFPGTLEALVHLTCDITTCVWGADLFKPAWLAAATQVTSPRCRARDSHLTLLSSKRTHCLRTERGK